MHTTRHSVGRYRGIDYRRQRISDVMAVPCRAYWYFTYTADGKPTGDHYRTLAELRTAVDSHHHHPTAQHGRSAFHAADRPLTTTT